MVTQQGRGYLYHSAGDTADQIDVYTLSGAVQMIAAAVQEIAGTGTPSYRAVAREEGQGYVYRQTRQTVIYFSMSREDTESSIGAAGTLTDTQEISGDGWADTYETYRYSMRWFDAEAPMNTYYQYRNGYLESIEIRPAETGYTAAQTRALIESMYGAPALDEGGQTGWEERQRPNALILSYPVVTAGDCAHRGSFVRLTGDDDRAAHCAFSLEDKIRPGVPPVFVWHTMDDATVPVENSLLLVSALRRAGVECEAHFFPHGVHGLSVCTAEVNTPQPHAAHWFALAAEWLRDVFDWRL